MSANTSLPSSALNAEKRQAALDAMTDAEGLDILVVGGGVTGAGIAVDAASRGLRTGIVEMGDWAAGTSSWSSKLVHGGLRYLYQLDFPLVAEALAERGRLLTETAPHLVKAQPFLWPLKHEVERAYSAVGVGMYDALALLGARGKATVPVQHHLTAKGTKRLAPSLDTSSLAGAIKFYDARVDDSRLVISLVRTAVENGALAATRTKVVEYLKNDHGRVIGARVEDLEASAKTGKKVVRDIYSRRVINATGVWTEQTQELAGVTNGLKVLASKGIHIVVPKEAIEAETGIFLRTEKSVLFIIPWPRYWVIGTTDTAWHENIDHPVATSADIDYVLEHANAVLEKPISRKDIIGVYAGLRPLLQPGVKEGESGETASTKVSREHTVTEVAPGLTSIAGGKLTTYRVMAADAVDFALGVEQTKVHPTCTERLALVGAAGLDEVTARSGEIARAHGWTLARVDHLLSRYGAETQELLELIDAKPEYGQPLESAPAFLKAEVAWAVTHEGALHLDDIIVHRVRLDLEQRDHGLAAADEIAEIAAPLLGWSKDDVAAELAAYARRCTALAQAEKETEDAAAAAHLDGLGQV